MTHDQKRETILEDIAVSVERKLDRSTLRRLMRASRNRDDAALATIASEVVERGGEFMVGLESVRQSKSSQEVMMEVFTTYVIPAQEMYPSERETRRVDMRVQGLRALRAYSERSIQKETVSA